MYKCNKCGNRFPVVAWLETTLLTTPNASIKKPCCPYCHSIEIIEVK